MMRRAASVALIAVTMGAGMALSGCISAAGYAANMSSEFVSPRRPARRVAPKGSDNRPTAATIEAMRLAAERNGDRMVAFVYVPNSFHHYTVAAYFDAPRELAVTATGMFWGDITGKWRSTVDREQFSETVATLATKVTCTETLIDPVGLVLVSWSATGERMVCDAGLWTEESAWLLEFLERITGPRTIVYSDDTD